MCLPSVGSLSAFSYQLLAKSYQQSASSLSGVTIPCFRHHFMAQVWAIGGRLSSFDLVDHV
jgi:hypothetical protein